MCQKWHKFATSSNVLLLQTKTDISFKIEESPI